MDIALQRALALIVLLGSLGLSAEQAPAPVEKWSLWINGTHLRGANIHQRRSYSDVDGPEIAAIGPVIPPYTQGDFDKLASLGANYVNISHTGLFTEKSPYALDPDIQKNLDQLLDMIARANLYAVISFRTGPGRNEFVFLDEEAPEWLGKSLDINFVWQDKAAQDAWVSMWRQTADRYKNNPTVVGYDLMVEPNSNVLLNIYEPTDFYPAYANTLYDWNQLYPRITSAIREVDRLTPILIGGMNYSAVNWLAHLKPTGDTRTVYAVHQYEPFVYTHQDSSSLTRTYPGVFDADGDNKNDTVDKTWLETLLAKIDTFKTTHNVPVASNEFGLMRWQPGADRFMADEMDLIEKRGMNHALWLWAPSDSRFTDQTGEFNLLLGPDPANRKEVATSDLLEVVKQNWGRNVSTSVPVWFISMSRSTYAIGDTVTASEFGLRHLQASSVAANLRVWIKVPNIGEINIITIGSDGTFAVPPNVDVNLGPLSLFTIQSSFPPKGAWEMNSRLTNPGTGAVISEDINKFEIK